MSGSLGKEDAERFQSSYGALELNSSARIWNKVYFCGVLQHVQNHKQTHGRSRVYLPPHIHVSPAIRQVEWQACRRFWASSPMLIACCFNNINRTKLLRGLSALNC